MDFNSVAIYTVNGLLAGLYWLAAHWAAWAALGVSLAAAVLLDEPAARDVLTRARRYDREETRLGQRRLTAHWPTVLLGLAWLAAAWVSPSPLPVIGLALWIGALVGPLCLKFGQRKALHRLRWFIAVYTALVLGFWLLVRFPLSPAQAAAWSERLQATGAGEALEWSIRAQFIPYIALLLWAIFPLTYFGYLAQQLSVQRRFIVSPRASAAERITSFRARGEA